MTCQRRLREGGWKDEDILGNMIAGQTVGIVGLGRVEANVARRLTGWEVRLLAADPYVEPAIAHAVGAKLVDLDTLVRESDVVTVHVVLTAETRHIIDEARLRAMKPTAYLVNTSRAGAVDTAALVRAIEEGWIAGAALDVYEDEPLGPDSALRQLNPERVILTPHAIGNNVASHHTGTKMAIESVLQALRGEVPRYLKNPGVVERWRERFFAAAAAR
jgi:phosphoglycerate dehydrogenase-like enzyme